MRKRLHEYSARPPQPCNEWRTQRRNGSCDGAPVASQPWTDGPCGSLTTSPERRSNTPQFDAARHDSPAATSNGGEELTYQRQPRRSKLLDGKLSMLVDLGSRINLVGYNTHKAFLDKSKPVGYKATYTTVPRVHVTGVGSDNTPLC